MVRDSKKLHSQKRFRPKFLRYRPARKSPKAPKRVSCLSTVFQDWLQAKSIGAFIPTGGPWPSPADPQVMGGLGNTIDGCCTLKIASWQAIRPECRGMNGRKRRSRLHGSLEVFQVQHTSPPCLRFRLVRAWMTFICASLIPALSMPSNT